MAKENILETIGTTPIVSLQKLAPNLSVNLYGKCEFLNPGGSIKDRIGLHIINQAEKKGLLKPGGTIIEATSGNTGMGLAMVAALRGYKCIFVMADKQSKEKQMALKAMGAHVITCPTDVAADDERSYYKVAQKLVRDTPNSFYANQYANQDNPDAHYYSTGPEIYEQCGDSLDYLIVGIGTGGTVSGISRYIKERNPKLKVIGVDPVGSIYYDLFNTGKMGNPHSYLVEGIGEDFLPTTINMKAMDDVVQVEDEESFQMARRLVQEQGLLVGGSTGAAVLGAIKYFINNPQPLNPRKKNALVILVDSSTRYLSKYLNDEWMHEKGFKISCPL
ncbi:MAG: cysteine synthase family protein [Myxococcales bacterium]|nr:MAG: cysteine synthase family protein [Myxococcales bacterium]